MADNARGVHVSPGVYSREIDLTYAVKSLGITALGLAGETQKGPAFQPMHISNWREFVSTFGGTNPEKFKGSQYPKYELPYIAKSYLTQSNQLEVVRVLGLSGYNMGPAWVITADMQGDADDDVEGTQNKMVVAVLRSRGQYYKYRKFSATTGTCACPNETYDTLVYEVGETTKDPSSCGKPTQYNENALELDKYNPLYSTGNDCDDYEFKPDDGGFEISATNYGRFKIKGIKGIHPLGTSYDDLSGSSDCFEYAVSLNKYDKDYILNVLGQSPSDGDAPIYVESLYDVSLAQAIANNNDKHATKLSDKLTFYQVFYTKDFCGLEPISSIMTIQESNLSRRNVGQRFLADLNAATDNQQTNDPKITFHLYDCKTDLPIAKTDVLQEDINEFGECTEDSNGFAVFTVKQGYIYTVTQYTNANGKRNYYYRAYSRKSIDDYANSVNGIDTVPLYDNLEYGGTATIVEDNGKYKQNITDKPRQVCVKNLSDGLYYRLVKVGDNQDVYDVKFVSCNINDYKSAYRYASTPWIVSNLMGDYRHIELKKLFRFHTISDGKDSNYEVKVSIENIRPDEGVFDVLVRDINDTDDYQVVLEKFSRCSLVPGTNNYIAFKIGSYDGVYESKSKYVTVECKEGDTIENSIPSGFLGYPAVQFDGVPVIDEKQSSIANPLLTYNTEYDTDVKNRKQYFGLSTRVGVDLDMFSFKGNATYIDSPSVLTHGFHLDSRLNMDGYQKKDRPKVTVDGESGYTFDAV